MTRKRSLDLLLSVLGAIAWVPVVLVAAVVVLVSSGRPVFYRSSRRVSSDRLMLVVKFRTMVKNADKIANRDTIAVGNVRFLNIPPSSPLYTRAGRVLERCGITERAGRCSCCSRSCSPPRCCRARSRTLRPR